MATATVTFPNLGDNPPDSSDCNQNFTDVLSFCNTHVIQSDASLAFTGLVSVDGAPLSTVDTQAVVKKHVDESYRSKEQRVRGGMYVDWSAGNFLSIEPWSTDDILIAIPSWATTAMITFDVSVRSYGGDSTDPAGRWRLWWDWGDGGFFSFAEFSDGVWGTGIITGNMVRCRTIRGSIPASLKGTTTNASLHVEKLVAASNPLSTGTEGVFDYDVYFWS